MRHERKNMAPKDSGHPLADCLEGAFMFVDESKESQKAVEFVKNINPDVLIVPAEQEHSDFTLPVLIHRDGLPMQRLYNIQRILQGLPDEEAGGS